MGEIVDWPSWRLGTRREGMRAKKERRWVEKQQRRKTRVLLRNLMGTKRCEVPV